MNSSQKQITFSIRSILITAVAAAVLVTVYRHCFPVDRSVGIERYDAKVLADALRGSRPVLLTCNAPWVSGARPDYQHILLSPAIEDELNRQNFRVIQVEILQDDLSVLTQLPGIKTNEIPFAAVYSPVDRNVPEIATGCLTETELMSLVCNCTDNPDLFDAQHDRASLVDTGNTTVDPR